MKVAKFKKRGIDKKAWLDWLSDEPPAPIAQVELRQKRVEQANRYVPRSAQAPLGTSPYSEDPTAVPQPAPQLHQRPPTTVLEPPASQPTTPPVAAPGVSIQINLPQLQKPQFKRLKAVWASVHDWARANLTIKHSLIVGTVVAIIVLSWVGAVIVRHNTAKRIAAQQGSAIISSAGGATAAYDKPPFQVVVPSTKPKLATPDGAHSAYDGKRNTFSFSDSLQSHGFIVSQQPVPANFPDGPTAASKIASQLSGTNTNLQEIKTLFGSAYVVTNTKYSSQTVVATVRELIVFIQSSHTFNNSDWTAYINALQ